jgi:hypothetical protein
MWYVFLFLSNPIICVSFKEFEYTIDQCACQHEIDRLLVSCYLMVVWRVKGQCLQLIVLLCLIKLI